MRLTMSLLDRTSGSNRPHGRVSRFLVRQYRGRGFAAFRRSRNFRRGLAVNPGFSGSTTACSALLSTTAKLLFAMRINSFFLNGIIKGPAFSIKPFGGYYTIPPFHFGPCWPEVTATTQKRCS